MSNPPITPEVKNKIWELYKQGKHYREIGELLHLGTSSVGYHIKKMTDKPKTDVKSKTANHVLTPLEIKNVRSLTLRGLSAEQIEKELGLSSYNIYRARKLTNTYRRNIAVEDRSKLGAKVQGLLDSGLTYKAISQKLQKPISQCYAIASYYRNVATKGGANLNGNGHNKHAVQQLNDTTNTSVEDGPTKAELIGFAWAEVERGIANIGERIKISPEVLRRRLSKLLGYSSVG